MWQYFIYFLIGGTVVASVAYVGSHSNGMLAAFVASLPVLFLASILLMYRNGGVSASIAYVKGSLLFLPMFPCYAALVIWLLPRVGLPEALVAGLPIYMVPILIKRMIRFRILKKGTSLTQIPEEAIKPLDYRVVSDETSQQTED